MTTVKTLTLSGGRTFKFGRKVPAPGTLHPTFKLGKYLDKANLPTPPATADYTAKAKDGLAQMYWNDIWGDCVIAGVTHTQDVIMANAGVPPLIYTKDQIQTLYGVCGFKPGQPATDQGCDIQTVLNYWKNTGAPAGSHKIAGFLAVDPTNAQECRTAIWLFENLITGICMPDAWVNPAPSASGFTWDVAGAIDTNNGHCFPFFGYDANRFIISTWGMTGYLTNGALAKYGIASAYGELYTVISQELIDVASQLAPNGLDWATLCADFNAMGGNITPPGPTPPPPTPPVPPPPTPTPPTPPTPPPTPTTLVPGSAHWMQAKLAPADYAAYVAELQHPSHTNLPGSPFWLSHMMSHAAYRALERSFGIQAREPLPPPPLHGHPYGYGYGREHPGYYPFPPFFWG